MDKPASGTGAGAAVVADRDGGGGREEVGVVVVFDIESEKLTLWECRSGCSFFFFFLL